MTLANSQMKERRLSELESIDEGRIRILTLQREAALNAFDRALYGDLAKALDVARDDRSVAVVVLTGRGRAFSAGQDMTEMAAIGSEMTQSDSADTANSDQAGFPVLMRAIESFDKPLIAGVNGIGVGIGFTILAHCDLVIMADDARLRAPFCPLGVAPEAASSVLFPERMGWQQAAWVLFGGDWVSASEAKDMGLAWKVVPSAQVLDEAVQTAHAFARWPITSLVATKRAMLDARSERVRRAREVEDAAFTDLIGSPANLEAVMAFLERRPPDFSGIPGA